MVGTGTLQEPHPSLNLAFVVVGSVVLMVVAAPLVGLGVLVKCFASVSGLWLIAPGPLTGFGVGCGIGDAALGVVEFTALPGAVERIRYRCSVLPES